MSPGAPPRLAQVAWPLFAELALAMAVGAAGTLLAARLGEASGAALALANQVLALWMLLFRVVGAGIGVVVAQHLGAGQRAGADTVALASLGAGHWVGLGSALLAALCAAPLLRGLGTPAEVLPLALPVLLALAPALWLDACNAAMASVLRAHLRSREVLAVMLLTQGLHLALLWPAMRGLGLPGFALALVASRLLGLGLHLALWRRQGLRPRRADWWRLRGTVLAPVLAIGAPGAAENIAYRLAFMASVAACAQLGTGALATHAYVWQITMWPMLAGVAVGLGVEIVVGHLVGAGQLTQAHRLVRRALARGLALAVAGPVLVALAGPWLLGAFSQDAAVLAQGAVLLWLTVLLEPGRTFNLVVINALRAAGDARFPVLVGAGSMAVVLAGGSWLLAVQWGWGLPGVWLAYAADEWLRGLLMWWRWRRGGWVPLARAARRRMRVATLSA